MMEKLQSWSLRNVEYSFIAITLRFILTKSGSVFQGLIYRINRTVQSLLGIIIILLASILSIIIIIIIIILLLWEFFTPASSDGLSCEFKS